MAGVSGPIGPNFVGYRELADQSPQDDQREQEEKRLRALEVLRARKDELNRSLGQRNRVEAITSSADEELRLRREVEELERQRAAKQQLDDRDEARRAKDRKFREAYVDPPKERFETETVRTRKEDGYA
jgi:hypothetical protein